MSQLTALVDKLLTNALQGYVPKGFIAELVLPTLKTKQSSGKIGKRGLGHLRIENNVMGGKAGAKRIEIRQFLSDSYFVAPHGLEEVVAIEEYANVELPFNLNRDVTVLLALALQLGKEKALADSLRSTSIITQNATLSGTTQWSDYTNSDPIGNVLTARNTIRGTSGVFPDTMICDQAVIDVLSYHPKVLRNLGYADNRAGSLSNDDIAKALKLRKILAADVMYNSAKEGQTDVLASLWGKDVVFAACPDAAAIDQKSLGYLVELEGDSRRKVYKQAVTNPPEATSIIVKDSYDMVLTDVKCAYLYKTAIA
jgi:hypothetical protein